MNDCLKFKTLTAPKLLIESSIMLPAVIFVVERDIEIIKEMAKPFFQGILYQSIM